MRTLPYKHSVSIQEKGFTLIELLIVITIVTILTSIAIPSYQQYTRKARYAEIIQAAEPLKLAVAICYQNNGTLANCQSGQHNIPKRSVQSDQLLHIAEVKANGVIHLQPHTRYGITAKDDLWLTPHIMDTTLHWNISGGAVIAGYVTNTAQ